MSLVSNARDVSFATRWPSDKIVKVWEGSFDRTADAITVTGDIGDIYLYRFPHGFTRPVFVDLIWKDSGAWTDGGCLDAAGDTSIAFSDNTYIYIVASVFVNVTGTMDYKVVGTWIDSYDTSNPLVESYIAATKETTFDTRVNYQKIYEQNSLSFNTPSTQSVAHVLGYKPRYRVYFEAMSGQIWPMFAGGNSNPFLYDTSLSECIASVTSSALEVELFTVPSTRRAWYKIYLDE